MGRGRRKNNTSRRTESSLLQLQSTWKQRPLRLTQHLLHNHISNALSWSETRLYEPIKPSAAQTTLPSSNASFSQIQPQPTFHTPTNNPKCTSPALKLTHSRPSHKPPARDPIPSPRPNVPSPTALSNPKDLHPHSHTTTT